MIRPSTRFALRLFLFSALSIAAVQSFAAVEDEQSIARMKNDIFFLASEECEGRGIETQGINKAADYIAAAFKEIGLKPGVADGNSYFQPFTIPGSPKLGAPNKFVLKQSDGKAIEPKINVDWTVSGLTNKGKIDAGLVFAGYGITQKEQKDKEVYDDYRGIDVKGKIVLVLRQTPRPGLKEKKDSKDDKDKPFPDAQNYAALAEKIANAEKHKAAGILFISDYKTAGKEDSLMSYEYARGGGTAAFPVFHIKRALVDEILGTDNKKLADLENEIDGDLKPRSFEIKGWSAGMEATIVRIIYNVKNVIGILEGKGPLANETIVIGAHYDHLGRGERGSLARGSTNIHFGADDNGSGSTAVMELARRFAAMKNREGRRIVFMTFSGEERGLLGSLYYCRNPLLPLKDTVAMINLDMVGRLRDDPKSMKGRLEIGGVGSAKSFEAMIDDLNKKYNFDIKKTRSGTGPSDHTSFFQKQVPVFFFFTGMHPEYHRPTDKPETINLEGMKKVVDMVEELASKIASDKERPEYVAAKSGKNDSPSPVRGIPTIRFTPGDYDDDQSDGVLVGGVLPGGPADKGGLKEGDWIIEIGGKPVKNMTGYMKVMGDQKIGEVLEFTVKRGDKKVPLKITPIPPAKMKD
jgi:hypothetical protein